MKNVNKKLLVVTIVALILAVSCVVGTFAYLAMKTEPIVNVFTSGNVTISLAETGAAAGGTKNFKMLPGQKIAKDPVITVEADSEACYLFVKIEATAQATTALVYNIADGWTLVDGETNVWSREVAAVDADTPFQVLAGEGDAEYKAGVVTVNNLDRATITGMNDCKLTITAYAVQKDGVADVAEAWGIAKGLA